MPTIIRFVVGFIWRVLALDVVGTAMSIIARIIITLLHRGFSIARIGAILTAISRIMPKAVEQRAQLVLNSVIDSVLSSARMSGHISYHYFGGSYTSISAGTAHSITAVFKVGTKQLSTTFGLNMQQGGGVVLNFLKSAQSTFNNIRIGEFNAQSSYFASFGAATIKNVVIREIRREALVYLRAEAKKFAMKELEKLIGKAAMLAIAGYITQLENLNASSTTPIEMSGYSEPFKIKLKIDLKAKLKAKSDKYVTNQKWFSSNGTCSGGLNNYCDTQSPPNGYGTCVETEKKKKWERKSGSTSTFSLDDQDAEFYVSRISVQHGSGIDSGLRSSINTWAAGLANDHSKLIHAINNTDPASNPNPKWSSVSGVLAKINNEFSSWLNFLNAISIVKSLGATLVGVGGCFWYDARQHASSYLNKITCSSITPPKQDPYGALCSWTAFSLNSTSSVTEGKTLETRDKTISFPSFYGWAEYNSSIGVAAFTFCKMEDIDTVYPHDPGWSTPSP